MKAAISGQPAILASVTVINTVDTNGTYQATNAVALGDRIDPQDVEFTGGRFVYRFLERKPDEPMAAAPSVEKRVEITVDPASNRISADN